MIGSKSKARAAEPTVIGHGAVIEGSVRTAAAVHVNGRIEGVLIAEGEAVIGKAGSVQGDVLAEQLDVQGQIDGNVSVRGHLHVAASGVLRGEVRYGTLQVERGGILAGSALRGEDEITIEAEALEPAEEPPLLPDAAGA
jgi:cytoskeletal protein CcmA (bactofilin family)